ncbi:MAG: hypothetical protein AAB522_00430 [Patescibacteria group bacterium]
MSEEKQDKRVYHYLHGEGFGSVAGEWLENKDFVFSISDRSYCFHIVDPRDQRTLVVFDGHIPWGGLPRGASIVGVIPGTFIRTQKEHVRKPMLWEEERLHAFNIKNNRVELFINRYLLLLPKSVACVRRYDSRSLRPIYTFIEVSEKGVIWRNSSY